MKMTVRRRAIDLLRRHHLMTVATCSRTGQPHAAVVLYVADSKLNLYFVTKTSTQKHQNLAADRRIAFSIGNDLDFNFQGQGRVRRMIDPKAIIRTIGEISQAAATSVWRDFWPPILNNRTGEYAVYQLIPARLRAVELRHPKISGRRPPSVDIIVPRGRRA